MLNLHYHLAANETSLKRPLAEDNNIERKRIARAFETEYQGTAIQTFYSRLTFFHSEWHRNEKPYVPYLTIIQNSGSGKTRLVGELSNLGIYVLYICKRHKDSSGYPAGTPSVQRILDKIRDREFYLQLFK